MAVAAPKHSRKSSAARPLPEEVPIAISCNGSSQAVMMATPDDLADFAWGFARTEGMLHAPDDVEHFEIVRHGDSGIEARFWLTPERASALDIRRRRMVGPVGCGLCGIDSLKEATRPARSVRDCVLRIPEADIAGATAALRGFQPMRDRSSGLHAAGFLLPGSGIVLAREDVGRHNALDKVCGALLRGRMEAGSGALVVTSRISVDLVQKCAAAGCAVLVGASTPTRLAVEVADAAGLTLVARARTTGYEVFSHPDRIA